MSTTLWNRWASAGRSDALVAHWVETIKRHNPPIASSGGFTVTLRQVEAMFASNDWVASTAGLPVSTPESRAAFGRSLHMRFASLSKDKKIELAAADFRWSAFQDPILNDSKMHAKAVRIVRNSVHRQQDVAREARFLENEGLKFYAAMNEFAMRQHKINFWEGKLSTVEGINMATRHFMGMGPKSSASRSDFPPRNSV